MELTINGKTAKVEGVRTLSDLIVARGLKPRLVAIELNGEIVPRTEYDERQVGEGDKLEIVHFVGGG